LKINRFSMLKSFALDRIVLGLTYKCELARARRSLAGTTATIVCQWSLGASLGRAAGSIDFAALPDSKLTVRPLLMEASNTSSLGFLGTLRAAGRSDVGLESKTAVSTKQITNDQDRFGCLRTQKITRQAADPGNRK
jgi:hypothetical protein